MWLCLIFCLCVFWVLWIKISFLCKRKLFWEVIVECKRNICDSNLHSIVFVQCYLLELIIHGRGKRKIFWKVIAECKRNMWFPFAQYSICAVLFSGINHSCCVVKSSFLQFLWFFIHWNIAVVPNFKCSSLCILILRLDILITE